MAAILGLDIGSNSVGSAWVDTDGRDLRLGASVFPAGVDEQEDKRGSPKNQARRQKRQQRRNLDRRSRRKRQLTQFLIKHGLLPSGSEELQRLYDRDPWQLRLRALEDPLSPHEFGRLVIHLAQRRGAVGVVTDPENPDEGKVKEGMDRLNALMTQRKAATFGQLMAVLINERRSSNNGVTWGEPIRNRQYRMVEENQLFAGRELVRDEFHKIVEKQRSFRGTALSNMLTEELVRSLDEPKQTNTWRHGGLLFGQRRTYWDTGTLGRCDLEPTERCAPIADRHASYFRVIETVNNIRIDQGDGVWRPLTQVQRDNVVALLRGPLGEKKGKRAGSPKTTVSVTEIREALGLSKRKKGSDPTRISLEADEDRKINTDWFHREIVHGAVGEALWDSWDESKKESVNRAILRFDPDHPDDELRLREGAVAWWGLDGAAAERLVAAWKGRPKPEKRLNLSRRAIKNLLPYMNKFDSENNRWPTQQEARKEYASIQSDVHVRRRYDTAAPGLTAADRYYMKLPKHQIAPGVPEPPPAPTLSNPVVRKAIHEVRRHLIAYLREFGRKPDRVVIEMARVTKQSEKQRNEALARNRNREKIRDGIIDEVLPKAFGKEAAAKLSLNQQRSAVDRVILARQQTQICPYCGKAGLTDAVAAAGRDLEIDHIVPYSRCGDNGLNNKVLVHRECNRGKSNSTPREWWRDQYDTKIQAAEKLFKNAKPDKSEYFTAKDYARKWENFTREVREADEWKNSQLSDTAYAARQVAAYLADALYDGRGLPERGDGGSEQKIFFTMGRFTSLLRKDWQLFESLKPAGGETAAEQELALAEKDRSDHRQHALDAVAIALTDPAIKNRLATWAAADAEHFQKTGKHQRRPTFPPPWGDVPTFRRQVLSMLYDRFDSSEHASGERDDAGGSQLLVVAHRPVKRRLVGAFHEDTHYGPVLPTLPSHRTERASTLFTNRISAERLTPNHLRVPEGWDELSAKLEDGRLSASRIKDIRRQLAALKDEAPGKSGIVRDRALRDRIRKCLRANGLNPDDFGKNDIKRLCDPKNWKLTMASGVPIKGVVLLRTNNDPVIVPRKRWYPLANRILPDEDPRTARVYIGGNNHHIEIRFDAKKNKWVGEIVSAFAAAKRARSPYRELVDRSDNESGVFVMSLAEGEMIYARRKDRPEEPPSYYVVCKLDKTGNSSRIHFAPHWDARKASEQDRWDVTPADLKDCGPEPGKPPLKVQVSPIGKVRVLEKD